jgi:hypothetical protein
LLCDTKNERIFCDRHKKEGEKKERREKSGEKKLDRAS